MVLGSEPLAPQMGEMNSVHYRCCCGRVRKVNLYESDELPVRQQPLKGLASLALQSHPDMCHSSDNRGVALQPWSWTQA